MKRLALLLALIAAPAFAAVESGAPAPTFQTKDTHGEAVSLESLKGKTVVLEWTNHGCPFVQKFYKSDAMQGFQKKATDDGVVWIRVISSAPGKQGALSAEEANTMATEQGVAASHTVLDPTGVIGKMYGAKTTPHMYVINPEGTLVYQGAIDDNPSPDSADIAGANNYVMAALAAVKEGKMPETTTSKPYGCGVKYE